MKLKSAIALMFAMPVIAFGGTCYQATSVTPAFVPATICIESIAQTNIDNIFNVEISNLDLSSEFKATRLSQHNEDRWNFTVAKTIAEEWEAGCGDGFSASLNIKGQIALGEISPSYLTLSVDVQRTNDTCHSPVSTETISYNKL